MNAKQDNKLAMYRAVVNLLTASSDRISATPKLVAKFETLQSKIERVLTLAATQALPSEGAVASKEQALDAMAAAALEVAGAVTSYATEHAMPDLASRVKFSFSALRYGRQQACVLNAQQIHDAAVPYAAILADYGVAATKLPELGTKIVAATEALSKPRGVVASRKAVTRELEPAMNEVDVLLEREIDPLMVPFRTTVPEFFHDYEAARVIIDRPGARHAKAAANTTIAVTPLTSASSPPVTTPPPAVPANS